MRIYEVRISHAALQDMAQLREFLLQMMSEDGALQIHPQARHMVSHNRRWDYVFHIEENFVIVDRIIPAKMNKG